MLPQASMCPAVGCGCRFARDLVVHLKDVSHLGCVILRKCYTLTLRDVAVALRATWIFRSIHIVAHLTQQGMAWYGISHHSMRWHLTPHPNQSLACLSYCSIAFIAWHISSHLISWASGLSSPSHTCTCTCTYGHRRAGTGTRSAATWLPRAGRRRGLILITSSDS